MEICQFKVYIQKDSLFFPDIDKMAEWLRRRTVNLLGSSRVGPSPIFVVFFIWFYGEMNSSLEVEFCNPSSNIGKKLLYLKLHPPPPLKFRKKNNITKQKVTSSAMF